MRLAGRTAFVTGGGQGIGEAIVRAFAAEGARVCVADVDVERAQKLASDVGGGAMAVACDVAKRADVERAVGETIARLRGIDVLVNNAGIIRPAMLHKMTDAQWQAVIDVHLAGTFHCLRAVAPSMMERRYGRIINVTSTAGVQGTIGQINYSAAKAGIIGVTKALALELAKRKITVNCVAPGLVETAMVADANLEEALNLIPMRRLGKPDEVAALVAYLFSDLAAYVTRQVITIDGGLA